MRNQLPLQTMELLGRMDGPDLRVHPQRCTIVRNRNVACLRCAEACASGAISAGEEGLAIDPARCIGCGTCASACPTGALEGAHPDDHALSAASAKVVRACDGAVTFACSKALDDGAAAGIAGGVELVCLGRLDASFLVELAARGAREVVFAHGGCAACAQRSGRSALERAVRSAKELLAAFDIDVSFRFADAREALSAGSLGAPGFTLEDLAQLAEAGRDALAAGESVALREGFEAGAADAQAQSARRGADGRVELPRVGRGGTLPQFVPTRRTRLFNALKAMPRRAGEAARTDLWATVSIDRDRCASCRLCAVFCPTGALRRTPEGEGVFGIVHQPTFCVACGACEQVCSHGALSLTDQVDLDAFLRGRKHVIRLEPPAWEPNKSDSIFQKAVSLLGSENNLSHF